jgi:hypothetical protein
MFQPGTHRTVPFSLPKMQLPVVKAGSSIFLANRCRPRKETVEFYRDLLTAVGKYTVLIEIGDSGHLTTPEPA